VAVLNHEFDDGYCLSVDRIVQRCVVVGVALMGIDAAIEDQIPYQRQVTIVGCMMERCFLILLYINGLDEHALSRPIKLTYPTCLVDFDNALFNEQTDDVESPVSNCDA
jgi:hypothetical protein